MRLLRRWTLIAALGVGSVGVGCKEDPMVRARAAHATERADEAEAALKKVLAANPDDFEARRMMADVHRFRGEYEKTEEQLEALWKEKGFGDDAKDLEPQERAQRDLLEGQFDELYAAWSDAVDPQKEPDKFVKVLTAGLERDKRSAQLNRKLVEFYFARGEELANSGERMKAAEAYESIAMLRALPAQRKDAAKKALDLRKEAFAETVKKHFEATAKPQLVEAEKWDAENNRIELRIEADVDRGLRQSNDEDLTQARKEAAETIRKTIAETVQLAANVPAEVAAAAGVKIASSDESLKRGTYAITVTMSVDDVIEGAFKAHEKARQVAEKKTEAPSGGADEAKDAAAEDGGGTNGGAATNGATTQGGEN